MLDIMCMISIFKDHPFVFVGKAELSKIPFFGVIYKRACILVDRSSPCALTMLVYGLNIGASPLSSLLDVKPPTK